VTAHPGEIDHVTCLGCGCACDDITVIVRGGVIVERRNACALGDRWFGDGVAPSEIRSSGRPAPLDQALEDAARLLAGLRRPLVYLAPDVTCETQRRAAALADRLGAVLDTAASAIAPAILAAQRRGRAAATLGEIRHQADLIVFWGVDPALRYPRYTTRYAVDPVGVHVPNGRRDRTLVAVDIGHDRGPPAADVRVTIAPEAEVDALGAMRAAVEGRRVVGTGLEHVLELARRMAGARYSVLVHDAEASDGPRDADRVEALAALAQALNGPSRAALSSLRGGGNRSGAEAVMTWQTGFPMSVDFAPGYPSYRPHDGAAALLARGEIDGALIVGAPGLLPAAVARDLARTRVVAIGPRASLAPFGTAVAIDTGVAGIHEDGMAFRMDDVPVRLRAVLDAATLPRAAAILGALGERLARR
jgi:formylmethanofuran dehydrogenase subunit B